jgi:hypothetical protein
MNPTPESPREPKKYGTTHRRLRPPLGRAAPHLRVESAELAVEGIVAHREVDDVCGALFSVPFIAARTASVMNDLEGWARPCAGEVPRPVGS